MQTILYFYLIFFVVPYVITLVIDDRLIAFQVFKVCLLPQFLLLIIEFVQIYENGIEYF